MKKFICLYFGGMESSPEIMDSWMKWFKSIETNIADMGTPLGHGQQISRDGISDIPTNSLPATGYTILNATDLNHALDIVKDCPGLKDPADKSYLRVYELTPMTGP